MRLVPVLAISVGLIAPNPLVTSPVVARPSKVDACSESKLIAKNRDLADAEFVKISDRLKDKSPTAVWRALGLPYKIGQWRGSEFWYYEVGRGLLVVEIWRGKVTMLGHQKEK